jgi:cell division protein FtsB
MAGTMESLSTINSFLRTLVAIVVVGAIGVGGWFGYSTYNANEIEARKKAAELKDANDKLAKANEDLEVASAKIERQTTQIAEQQTQIDDLNVQVKKLETSLAFLKVDHRVAKFTALDQTKDEATGDITTLIEFVEVNDEGVPIDTPRQFRLPGDTVYIDSWVVRFKDEFVEQNDLERGSSLMLFKRVFGSGQKPTDGYPLDEVGSAPRAYARGGKLSDFEKKIWDNFWTIANDPGRQEELGIRSGSGVAPNMKVEKGKTYEIRLRAAGDPEMRPADAPPPAVPKAEA